MRDNPDLFYMLLYQHGGQLYRDDMTATALDSDESVEAFTQWADLYNKYKAPQKVDLLTSVPHRRSSAADYQLQLLRPGFRHSRRRSAVCGISPPSPGTPPKTGSTVRVGSSVTGTVMFRNARIRRRHGGYGVVDPGGGTQADYARDPKSPGNVRPLDDGEPGSL